MVLTIGPVQVTVTWVQRPRPTGEPVPGPGPERFRDEVRLHALFLYHGLTPPPSRPRHPSRA
ncbi:MAG: hypothetical protein DIU70_005985 [Bacillota bacterium]